VQRTLERGGFISSKHLPDGSTAPYEMNINYLDALIDPAREETSETVARRFLTAQAMMLCLQGMPGIYFHSLVGSRGDRAGAEASGSKRRINREKLELARLEAELADPASLRAQVFGGYRALLASRRACAALAPSAAQQVLALDRRVFAVRRESPDGRERVLCLHNVSGEAVTVQSAELGLGETRLEAYSWRWVRLP
jgi:sucrose phosphorylase